MAQAKVIDKDYRPSDDEPFMNERQRDYFRKKLLAWKDDILRESRETLIALQSESENHPDIADRASSETDRAIELRARDRQRKLISKIDAAISRIDDGTYGYCEETGEPISLKRLAARPPSCAAHSNSLQSSPGLSRELFLPTLHQHKTRVCSASGFRLCPQLGVTFIKIQGVAMRL